MSSESESTEAKPAADSAQVSTKQGQAQTRRFLKTARERDELDLLLRRGLWTALIFFVFCVLDSLIESQISPFLTIKTVLNDMSPLSARAFVTSIARLLGFLLAACITLCGIAVPLTANNYTPKLIMLFIKDRLNWVMLGLLVYANILAHWTLLSASGNELPIFNLIVVAFVSFISLIAMVPYIFYLFRMLLPQSIINRIETEISEDLEALTQERAQFKVFQLRARIFENLKCLSNISLRSVDRHDRDTALYSLEAMKDVFDRYVRRKKKMAPDWFVVDEDDFLSKPIEVLDHIQSTHSVFEVEILEECSLNLSVSINSFKEGVRMVGSIIRHIAYQASIRDDQGALEVTILYFNSFIRAGISKKSPDTIYTLMFQYRHLAEELLLKKPQVAVKIAFYLDYYGHQSVRSGLVFVANLVAYDLADLVIQAFRCDAPCKHDLFRIFVDFDRNEELRNFPGIVKSHIKLLTHMINLKQQAEVETLETELKRIEPGLITKALAEINAIKVPLYWEVTERRRHIDYVDPEYLDDFADAKRRVLDIEAELQAARDSALQKQL